MTTLSGRILTGAAFLGAAFAVGPSPVITPAQAQIATEAGVLEKIEVPEGPLGQALIAIGTAYGVSVVGPDDLVTGRRAPAVAGEMTVEEALARVLEGSGLEAQRTGDASFIIAKASERQRRTGALEDEIIVRGRAQNLYRVTQTNTAKLPVDPLDATQVVTTINSELIRDQGIRNAQELYRNIAGVTQFSYAGVTARGFRQEEIYFDGLRGNPYTGFVVPQLFNIERVDVLKGPAGALYGRGAPGGLFNYASKKPSREFSAELRGIVGTEARYGGSFEITGALPVDGTAGRVGVFVEDRNTPRKNTASRIASYDIGLSAELPFAKLTLQGTRYEQDLGGNRLRGVPVDDDGNFIADRRWNHNEETDFLDLRSNNIQAILDGEIGSEIKWNSIVRYTESTQSQEYHEPRALFDTDGDGVEDLVGRDFRDLFDDFNQLSIGANLIWDTDFGRMGNRLMSGYEYYDTKRVAYGTGLRFSSGFLTRFLDGTSLPSDIIPLRLNRPNYGQTQPENYVLPDFPPTILKQSNHGAYALNEATIGNFIFVGGIRFDHFSDTMSTSGDFGDESVTFKVGGVYKPVEYISIFIQWADSYVPANLFFQDPLVGGPFDPTTGTSIEGGVKARLFEDRFFVTLSAFDIKRQNVLQQTGEDPGMDGRNDFIAFGEVTSTGVELEFTGDITPDWVMTASYAYNDIRITKDNGNGGFGAIGDRFPNAPENQFGFWTRYQIPAINTAFAIGGDYVSERINLAGQGVKPYFVADASIIWDNGEFDVLLRASNLFDKTYSASGFGFNFPGDPRSVFVEVSRKW